MGWFDFLTKPGGYADLPAIQGDPVRVLGRDMASLPEVRHELKFTGLIDDIRAALTVRTLVHGPGASDGTRSGGDFNSAVFACLRAIADNHTEPPLRVYRLGQDGKRDHIPDHPYQQFLDDPNPALNVKELLWWAAWVKFLDGNSYLRKIRSSRGNVLQLWPISPLLLEPFTQKGSGDFLTGYRFQYEPGRYVLLPPEDIIHFRVGIDDRDHRRGLSPIKRLVREVTSDDTATVWTQEMLANGGYPGLMVELPPDSTVSRDQAEEMKERFRATFGDGRRGDVGVLSPGAKMSQFGFSPEQLNLEAIHRLPESRVCAVMRVHPAIAMLAIGIEQTANYASLRQVTENFAEQTLIPSWRMDEAKLNHQLTPDFDGSGDIVANFDLSEVRALQEDVNAKVQRLDLGVKSGWILPNEARQEIGLEPLPEMVPQPVTAQPPQQEEDEEDEDAPALRIAKALEAKQFTPEALPALLGALADLAEPQFRRDIEDYLDGQRRRIRARLVSGGNG